MAQTVGRSASVMTRRSRSAVRSRMPCSGQTASLTPGSTSSERVAKGPKAAQRRGLAEDLHRLEQGRRDASAGHCGTQRTEGGPRLDTEPVDDGGPQRLLDRRGAPRAAGAEHTGAVV